MPKKARRSPGELTRKKMKAFGAVIRDDSLSIIARNEIKKELKMLRRRYK